MIELRRSGQFLVITPAVPLLHGFFFTVFHDPIRDPVHGHGVRRRCYPILRDREQYGLSFQRCWAGLEPMLVHFLKAAGFEVRLSGSRPSPLGCPRMENLETIYKIDTPLLELVQKHERGLISYDPARVKPATLIAEVALAWPNSKVLVTATRVNHAQKLRRQLQRYFPDVKLFTSQHCPAEASRVTVATFSRVAEAPVRGRCRDICFTVDPTEIFTAYQGTGLMGLQEIPNARLYGLLSDQTRVAPSQRPLLAALFGLQQVRITRHGMKALHVDVLVRKITGGERLPKNLSDTELKVQGIWLHPVRNRRIARLFMALTGKPEVLGEFFPEVAAHLLSIRPIQVGILVEGVEHGLELKRLLPNVPLVGGKFIWKEGASGDDLDVLQEADGPLPRHAHAIVTAQAAEAMGGFNVILRADGGRGMPALPNRLSVKADDDDSRVLLVDFRDEHHPRLRKWSGSRRTAYVEAGWNVHGVEVDGPMDKFVALRPRVC